MSLENVGKFFELAKNNKNVAKELNKIKDKLQQKDKIFNESQFVKDEIIPLAQKNGIDFAPEEFLNYVKAQISELSDEDLLNVSGGGSFQNFMLAGMLAFFSSLPLAIGVSNFKLVENVAQETTQNSETSSQTSQGGSDGAEASAKAKTERQKDKSSEKKADSKKKSSKKAKKNMAASRAQRDSSSRPGLSSRRGATQNESKASAGLQSDVENLNQPQLSTPTDVSSEHSAPAGSEIAQNNSVKSFTSEPQSEPTPNIKTDVVTPAPAPVPVVNPINKTEPAPKPEPEPEPQPEPAPGSVVNPVNNKTTPEPDPLPDPNPNIKPEPTPQPVVVNPENDDVHRGWTAERARALANYLRNNFDLGTFNEAVLDSETENSLKDFLYNSEVTKKGTFIRGVKIDNEDAAVLFNYGKQRYNFALGTNENIRDDVVKVLIANKDPESFVNFAESMGYDGLNILENLVNIWREMKSNYEYTEYPQLRGDVYNSASQFISKAKKIIKAKNSVNKGIKDVVHENETPTITSSFNWQRIVYWSSALIADAALAYLGYTYGNVIYSTVKAYVVSLFNNDVPLSEMFNKVVTYIKDYFPSSNVDAPQLSANISANSISNAAGNSTDVVNGMLLKNPVETVKILENAFNAATNSANPGAVASTINKGVEFAANTFNTAASASPGSIASAINKGVELAANTFNTAASANPGAVASTINKGVEFAANTLNTAASANPGAVASTISPLNMIKEAGKSISSLGGQALNKVKSMLNTTANTESFTVPKLSVENLNTTLINQFTENIINLNANSAAPGSFVFDANKAATIVSDNFNIDTPDVAQNVGGLFEYVNSVKEVAEKSNWDFKKIGLTAVAVASIYGLYRLYNYFKGAPAQAQAPDTNFGGQPPAAGASAANAALQSQGANENPGGQAPADGAGAAQPRQANLIQSENDINQLVEYLRNKKTSDPLDAGKEAILKDFSENASIDYNADQIIFTINGIKLDKTTIGTNCTKTNRNLTDSALLEKFVIAKCPLQYDPNTDDSEDVSVNKTIMCILFGVENSIINPDLLGSAKKIQKSDKFKTFKLRLQQRINNFVQRADAKTRKQPAGVNFAKAAEPPKNTAKVKKVETTGSNAKIESDKKKAKKAKDKNDKQKEEKLKKRQEINKNRRKNETSNEENIFIAPVINSATKLRKDNEGKKQEPEENELIAASVVPDGEEKLKKEDKKVTSITPIADEAKPKETNVGSSKSENKQPEVKTEEAKDLFDGEENGAENSDDSIVPKKMSDGKVPDFGSDIEDEPQNYLVKLDDQKNQTQKISQNVLKNQSQEVVASDEIYKESIKNETDKNLDTPAKKGNTDEAAIILDAGESHESAAAPTTDEEKVQGANQEEINAEEKFEQTEEIKDSSEEQEVDAENNKENNKENSEEHVPIMPLGKSEVKLENSKNEKPSSIDSTKSAEGSNEETADSDKNQNENVNTEGQKGGEAQNATENQEGKKIMATNNVEKSEKDENIEDKGFCGDPSINNGEDVKWTLYKNGKLEIDGKGKMKEFGSIKDTPEINDNFSKSLFSLLANDLENNPGWHPSRNRIKKIIIKNGVTSIGRSSFCYCESLTEVIIPSSIKSIGDNNFNGCLKLQNIFVDNSNMDFTSENGVVFSKDKKTLVRYPTGKEDKSYEIPNTVTKIGSRAFLDCKKIQQVKIPANVERINACAFGGCVALKNIEIPDDSNLRTIDWGAFENCNNLTSIKIPAKATEIGHYTFKNCSALSEVTFDGKEDLGKKKRRSKIPVPKRDKKQQNSLNHSRRMLSSMPNDINKTCVFEDCPYDLVIKVPKEYSDATFCGKPVIKEENFGNSSANAAKENEKVQIKTNTTNKVQADENNINSGFQNLVELVYSIHPKYGQPEELSVTGSSVENHDELKEEQNGNSQKLYENDNTKTVPITNEDLTWLNTYHQKFQNQGDNMNNEQEQTLSSNLEELYDSGLRQENEGENNKKLIDYISSDDENPLNFSGSSQKKKLTQVQTPTENKKQQPKSAIANEDEQTSNNNSKKDDDNMAKPGDVIEEEDNQNTSKWTRKRVQDLYNNLGSFNGKNKLPPELRQELYDFFDDVEVLPDAQEMTFKVGNVSIKGNTAQKFHDWALFSNVVYNPNAGDRIKELSRYVMFSGSEILRKMENYSNKYGKWAENSAGAKENVKAFINDFRKLMTPEELNKLPIWGQEEVKKQNRFIDEFSKKLETNLEGLAKFVFNQKWSQEKVDELVNAVSSDNSESDLVNEWTLINFLKNIDVDYENKSGLAFKLHVNDSIINVTGEQAKILCENISKYVRIWFNPIFVKDSEKISKENKIEISEKEKIKLALKCVAFNNGYRDLHLATQYGELKFIKSENSKDNVQKNLLEAEQILEGLSSKSVWEKIQPWAQKMANDFTWSQERVNNVFTLIEKKINGISSVKVIPKEQKEISQFVNNLVILGDFKSPNFVIGGKRISDKRAQTIIDLKGKVSLDIIFDPYAKDKEMEALRCTTLSPDFLSMQANLASHFGDNSEKINKVLVDFLDTLINVQNKNTISKYKSWVQDLFNNYIESIKNYFNVENLEGAKANIK